MHMMRTGDETQQADRAVDEDTQQKSNLEKVNRTMANASETKL